MCLVRSCYVHEPCSRAFECAIIFRNWPIFINFRPPPHPNLHPCMKSMHGNWKDVISTTAHKEEFVAAKAKIVRRHEQPERKRSLERNNEMVEVTGTVAEASLRQTYLNTCVIPEASESQICLFFIYSHRIHYFAWPTAHNHKHNDEPGSSQEGNKKTRRRPSS